MPTRLINNKMGMAFIEKGRIEWIDALRGLAILLVVYGHCAQNCTTFFVFTSPVKMPLFFAISGFLINDRVAPIPFLLKLVKKVVAPWLLLGLFFPILSIPLNGFSYLIDHIAKMLSGELYWFMPCFVVAQLIHFLIRKVCKQPLLITVAAITCFTIGILLHQHGLLNYAMFNRALVAQLFFLIGYLIKTFNNVLVKLSSWLWIGVLSLIYVFLCYLSMRLFPGQIIDVHMNQYYNIPYSLLTIILGCLVLFIAAQKCNVSSGIMSFIGQNTLVLYMWHGMAIVVLVKILLLFGWAIPANCWTTLLKLLWAVILCGIAALIINRYFPWVVGKGRRTHSHFKVDKQII